eukprot:COSAG06_NODE_1399_length_9580_cov_24.435292_4_plen_129_part_00
MCPEDLFRRLSRLPVVEFSLHNSRCIVLNSCLLNCTLNRLLKNVRTQKKKRKMKKKTKHDRPGSVLSSTDGIQKQSFLSNTEQRKNILVERRLCWLRCCLFVVIRLSFVVCVCVCVCVCVMPATYSYL